jgi:hypothetical protein
MRHNNLILILLYGNFIQILIKRWPNLPLPKVQIFFSLAGLCSSFFSVLAATADGSICTYKRRRKGERRRRKVFSLEKEKHVRYWKSK